MLALEKSILASFQGQAPDPSWAGPLSGAQFFELIGQLIELLTSREADGSSILAERLNALEFPGHYPSSPVRVAGEFLVVGGNGDVYSVEEGRAWLEQAGWHFVEHKPLAGPASLLVAEAQPAQHNR